jgi:hypothetical protein
VNEEAQPISEVSHEIIEGETVSNSYNTSGEITQKSKGPGFKEELSAAFEDKWEVEDTYTLTHTIDFHPVPKPTAYYLTQQPNVHRADYQVFDVTGTPIYNTYYFWVSAPKPKTEAVDLPSNLIPNQPQTYMNRGINFKAYDSYTKDKKPGSVPWVYGTNVSETITIGSGLASTFSVKVSYTYEGGEEIFNIGGKGSFEWETTTNTTTEEKLGCATRLNAPAYPDFEPNDINNLEYDFYWLKPTAGQDNRWFYPGQDKTQKTWCLTYDVTGITYADNRVLGLISASKSSPTAIGENENQVASYLTQSFPNPFSGTTTLTYQVCDNKGLGNSGLTQLTIYNVMGKQVAILVNQEQMPGMYEIEWNASGLPSGTYFGILQSGSKKEAIKLVLIK